MFFGRDNELKELNDIYESNRLEVVIMYGRRRVGKSELLRQFCKDKKTIFFTAVENSSLYNLNIFTETIFSNFSNYNLKIPTDYIQLLDLITQIASKEKIVLVIDEYPYLVKSEKVFSSLLQKYIDFNFKDLNMKVILCGSSISFMEKHVLGSKSPLYGRRTAQFKVKPFSYIESSKFYDNYSNIDKLLSYGIFGGTPYYLLQINKNISLIDNVINLFFKNSGILLEEPYYLIKQELRETNLYYAIITAIANGSTKLNEISSKIGKTTNVTDVYIKKLIEIDLIKKIKPVGEKNSVKSIYLLKDNMFSFWFRNVQNNLSLIGRGFEKSIVIDVFKYINDYMGLIYEEICIEYLWRNYLTLPAKFKEIGKWWGNNPIEKREEDIDILGIESNIALFGECKFRNSLVDIDVFHNLKRKSEIFNVKKKYFYFFSKSGFTNEFYEYSKDNEFIKLITLDDLFK